MRILVYIKAVPGYIANPRVSEAGDRIDCKTGPLAINESDEYALDAALALKKEVGGEVSVMSAGPLSFQEVLYKGLAKGADRGVRVDANLADSGRIARVLAAATRCLDYDLILSGVESSDNMAAVVGQSAAEMLGLPFIYSVTNIKQGQSPETITVTRELGGGVSQVLEVRLPALLCMQSGTVPLSFIPLRKIMQARAKAVDCLAIDNLGINEKPGKSSPAKIVDVFRPQKGAQAEIISGKPTEVASVLMNKIREAL